MRPAQLFYFMLPAYAANMAPPFVRYWKGWNPPIAAWYLGTHKTVGGFAAGIAAATIVTYIQSRIGWHGDLTLDGSWPGLGLRFGVGAMGGDAAKSFVKRRLGIPPGHAWVPFDQLDFVAGALLLTWRSAALSWLDVVAIVALSALGHIAVNHLGFYLGIRDAKW